MQCYLADGQGIDSISLSHRAAPAILNDRDVLVEVKACSLNYRDLMIAKGTYSAHDSSAPFIPLSDMAGEVKAVGSKVSALKPGDRVLNHPFRHWPAGTLNSQWARTFVGCMGMDGVLAEQIVYPADALIVIPDYLSYVEASTFTIAGLTAWAAVVTHGRIRPGNWVLLQGTGGVSIFAAQLAHAMGAKTIMTTSCAEKAEYVKKNIGVTATVIYQDPDWHKQVKQITQGAGVDVVVDVVGGETLSLSLQTCSYGARVAVIGVLSGQNTTLRIRDLLAHQVALRGIYMESAAELRAFVCAVEALKIKPSVDKVFSFSQVREAYRHLESQKHIGKVVIAF